ncbi:MAG: hypothetical protein MJ181_10045 [Treponema sp.]|nr:hypothetical protein [Treponema sp.]
MANSNATQLNINLQDSLNLNTNKAEISDFAGFNRRNAPFFNGGLSPLFKQEKTGSVIDKEGNVYTFKDKQFKKNDVILEEIPYFNNQRKLVKTEFIPTSSNSKFVLDKYGREVYIDLAYKRIHYGNSSKGINYSSNPDNYFIYSVRDYIVVIVIDDTQYVVDRIILIKASETEPAENYLDDENYVKSFTTSVWDQKSIKYFSVSYADTYRIIIQPGLDGSYKNEIGNVSKICKPVVLNKASGVFSNFQLFEISESYIAANVPHHSYFINPNFQNGTFTYLYSLEISGSNYSFTPLKTVSIANIVANSIHVLMDEYRFHINGICEYDNEPVTISIDSSQIDARINQNTDIVIFGEGCSAPNTDGVYDQFYVNSKHYLGEIGNYSEWAFLYNNNKMSGISMTNTLLVPWLDVDSDFTPFFNAPINSNITGNVFNDAGFIVYKSSSDKKYYKIESVDTVDCPLSLIDNRYIVANTTIYWNAYDTKEQKLCHIFDDWNNRLSLGSGTVGTPFTHPVYVASAISPNYEILMDPNISALFNPVPLYCAMKNGNKIFQPFCINSLSSYLAVSDKIPQELDCFTWFEDSLQTPKYEGTIKLVVSGLLTAYKFLDEKLSDRTSLQGVNYPVSTDGNIILTPSLLATFYDSQIGADYIKDGRYYNLIYYEGMPLLAYYYGSGVANSEARFVIQGQSFVIRNGLIYSTTYNNGLMYVNNAIVNVDDLQFIGCLPLAAFFFSPATKCVLAFTGDRNLSTAFEATELKSVINYKYAPNDNSLYLATEDAVYVLFNTPDGTSFVYKIEEQNVTDFVPQDNGCIALKTGNTWKIFSFYERPDFEKVPLKLTTKFFGAGLNRVSTVDCWYIRAFTEKAEKGKIKVKVQTLTNKSCTSEEQEFLINKEDWDANNGFIYLRYQPKLQRSVGVSLELESDFAIYDIQASIKADYTIQITSEKGF